MKEKRKIIQIFPVEVSDDLTGIGKTYGLYGLDNFGGLWAMWQGDKWGQWREIKTKFQK